MSTAASKAPAVAPRPRPYRDFLTPLLHKRFTSAVLLTTCLSYAESILMGDTRSPWEWFTLAIVRTVCLIISSLFMFILRMAHLHLGARNTVSPLEGFWKQSVGVPAVRAFVLYLASSAVFLETYIWFGVSDMGMVDHGKAYERDRVNERSVYLRCIFLVALPLIQTVAHLFSGYDTVNLPASSKEGPTKTNGSGSLFGKIPINLNTLVRSAIQSIATTVVGTILYWCGLHELSWRMQYSLSRTFFLVPKGSGPRTLLLGDFVNIFGRSVFQGALLILLWSFINILFNFYIARPPLKKDQPITNESKDPNGSLLVGLKAKKEIAKTFAFWELAMITQRFDVRRRTIYEEVERSNGTTWRQILQVCLAEINAISKRIEATKSIPQPVAVAPQPEPIQTLPRISSQGLRDEDIFSGVRSSTSRFDRIGNFARSHGSSQNGPPLSPGTALKLIEYGTDRVASQVMAPEQKAKIKKQGVTGLITEACSPLIRAPYIGQIFRQTFRRRANVVILSAPYSRSTVIINAVTSIVELTVQSLKEDIMGQVSKDVPSIVRALAEAIANIESFLRAFEVHWTDVEFKEENRRSVPEVEALIKALREGLQKVLVAHGEYLETEGMSRAEIKEVKAILGPEMAEKR